MQFEVTMRGGSSHFVEASYLEVVEGPTSSSYTLLGPVPGFPTAIVAAFPAELVHAIMPVTPKPYAQRRTKVERGPMADERPPSDPPSSADDAF
jgi:hypothetical protein